MVQCSDETVVGVTMSNPNEYNRRNIEEFRRTGGRVGGNFEGRPLILLTTTGAKTGRLYTTPVMYRRDGGRIVIFASKGGAPTNPGWYHNLVANPTVTVELGSETFQAKAAVATGRERDDLYALQSGEYPVFGEYQQKTTRKIPVVILERIA